MHKGFMLSLAFLLFHEYLDTCSAHLADDDVLGSGDANRAAISFLFTNQFAVDSIELHLFAIAETADGDDTALGSNHHTALLCCIDVVSREASVSFHPIELSRSLIGWLIAVGCGIDSDVVAGCQIYTALLIKLVVLHIRAGQRVMELRPLGGISELQLPIGIADSRLGAWLYWFVLISRDDLCDIS